MRRGTPRLPQHAMPLLIGLGFAVLAGLPAHLPRLGRFERFEDLFQAAVIMLTGFLLGRSRIHRHPAHDPAYHRWLAFTPWTPERPLPGGSFLPVPADGFAGLVLMAGQYLLAPAVNPLFPLLALTGGYLVAASKATPLMRPAPPGSAIMLFLVLPLWLYPQPALVLVHYLLGCTVTAWLLWRGLLPFVRAGANLAGLPASAEQIRRNIASLMPAGARLLPGPPAAEDFPRPVLPALCKSLVWVALLDLGRIHILGLNYLPEYNREGTFFIAIIPFLFFLFAPLGNLNVYWGSGRAPLSPWGRLVHRHLVFPHHDKIFLVPLLLWSLGLVALVGFLVNPSRVLPWMPWIIGMSLFLSATAGPGLQKWLLTAPLSLALQPARSKAANEEGEADEEEEADEDWDAVAGRTEALTGLQLKSNAHAKKAQARPYRFRVPAWPLTPGERARTPLWRRFVRWLHPVWPPYTLPFVIVSAAAYPLIFLFSGAASSSNPIILTLAISVAVLMMLLTLGYMALAGYDQARPDKFLNQRDALQWLARMPWDSSQSLPTAAFGFYRPQSPVLFLLILVHAALMMWCMQWDHMSIPIFLSMFLVVAYPGGYMFGMLSLSQTIKLSPLEQHLLLLPAFLAWGFGSWQPLLLIPCAVALLVIPYFIERSIMMKLGLKVRGLGHRFNSLKKTIEGGIDRRTTLVLLAPQPLDDHSPARERLLLSLVQGLKLFCLASGIYHLRILLEFDPTVEESFPFQAIQWAYWIVGGYYILKSFVLFRFVGRPARPLPARLARGALLHLPFDQVYLRHGLLVFMLVALPVLLAMVLPFWMLYPIAATIMMLAVRFVPGSLRRWCLTGPVSRVRT